MSDGASEIAELPADSMPTTLFETIVPVRINPHSTVRLRLHTKLERALVRMELHNCRIQKYGLGEPKLLIRGAKDPSAESMMDKSIVYALEKNFPDERIYVFCDTLNLRNRADLTNEFEEKPKIHIDKIGFENRYDDQTRQFFTSRLLIDKLPENGLVYFITNTRDAGNRSLVVNSLEVLGHSFVTLCMNQERDESYEVQMFRQNPLGPRGSVILERRERAGRN
jgi:hypothetical protein